MRTTLEIDDGVLEAAKELAAVQKTTAGKVISDLAALALLNRATTQLDHVFWPDDISLTDPKLFDQTHILAPKQLTDIYLLALAVKNGGRPATLDRAIPIAAVRGAEPRHVAVIG